MRIHPAATIVASLVLLLSLSCASAAVPSLTVRLVPAGSAAGSPVFFSATDPVSAHTESGTALADASGTITLSLPSGYYNVRLGIDDPTTTGFDLFTSFSVDLNGSGRSITSALFPVGSLKAMVTDAGGRPVAHALLRLDCEKDYGEETTFYTDEFGRVSVPYVPDGNCTLRSAVGQHLTTAKVAVTQGGEKTVTLVFQDYRISGPWTPYALAGLAVLAVAAAAWLFWRRRSSGMDPVQRQAVTQGEQDLLTALSETEREVVEYLLEGRAASSEPSTFYASQARIVYGAGIPKTSLVRTLKGLERKRIVTIEKVGKLKKVSLTDWFLKR